MSQWIDRINNHQIFSLINNLQSLIEGSREIAQHDPNANSALERIDKVISYLKSLLSQTDQNLINPGILTNITPHLNNVLNEINSYSRNHNIGHLNNANTNIDNLLPFLGQIPAISTSADLINLKELSEKYYKFLDDLIIKIRTETVSFENERKNITTRIEELSKEISTQKQRLDNALNDFTNKTSEFINKFIKESIEAENKRRIIFDEESNERLSETKNAEEKRIEIFKNQMNVFESTISKLITDSGQKIQDLIKNYEDQVKSKIDFIENQKVYAEKIVGLVSITGMSGGYQRVANEELKSYKFWTMVAFFSLLGLVIFALVSFHSVASKETFEWGELLSRLLVTIPFALLAGFAGLLAERHKRTERINRQRELEIASIDPFLATLTDEERNQVKKQVAAKIFGEKNSDDSLTGDKDSKNILELVEKFLNVIVKLAKH